MSRSFWLAFWATLLTFAVVFALGVWFGSVRNQCEALGGTLLMSNPWRLCASNSKGFH